MSRLLFLPTTFLALSAIGFLGCDSTTDAAHTPPTSDAASDATPLAAISDGLAPNDGGPSTTDAEAPPQGAPIGVRDRAGRPLVSQLLISPSNQDDYNASEREYTVDPQAGTPPFGSDFQSHLVTLDMLDGVAQWNGGEADAVADDAGVYPHPLATPWLSVDALLVDPTKPFSPTGYLDVEMHDGSNMSCGGRWFGDDAIDKMLSVLIKKSSSGVSDGVSTPAKAPSMTFPYLAAPN
jgi:hypothetical protein